MAPRDFIRRASGAFFVWPKALLDETLNRPLLANTVKHDLFADNAKGWDAYVEERRKEVPWFGEALPDTAESAEPAHAASTPAPVPAPQKQKRKAKSEKPSRYSTWPWPDKPTDA
jgi:hypothetical protein